jgi:hypothetical protein
MIVERYEKGQSFLDLERHLVKSLDADGDIDYDECWECIIYKNDSSNYNEHKIVEFGSESLARMFIQMNNWTLQVL